MSRWEGLRWPIERRNAQSCRAVGVGVNAAGVAWRGLDERQAPVRPAG